jgi:TPR repeat protein
MIHLAENLTEPSDKNIVQDLVTAKYWWSRAAEAGDAYAMYRLGDCLEHGIGVSVINLEDAFKWYRLASQNGNEDASEATKRFSRSITCKVKIKKVA